ncbi:hypothetical protein CFAM422_009081 [Trichoderma lentiforme]|uniref:Uncharacterized protein n=1 Tax=Trichoderma lentiforme TaxID=1567552 RepID=A0A9P4XAR1_9HYPO|nr:hypothetical protein CFAM422_009081 [Trichoderma lentiforme]
MCTGHLLVETEEKRSDMWASWTEIADGTLCGQDPDKIGVSARWTMDGTEDERQGFGSRRGSKMVRGCEYRDHVVDGYSLTPARSLIHPVAPG